MLVYGDQGECLSVGEALARLADLLGRVPTLTGLARHAATVSLLIEAGRLQQGLEDCGGAWPELAEFVMELGRAVVGSWDSGFAAQRLPELPAISGASLAVDLKVPEGYAFYALYPEAYATAARKLTLSATPRVIGIRSIGTSLAAVVAAALGAPPPVTVRPTGDPFARQLTLDDATERTLMAGAAHFVIVDEGPGLSGSSFGTVADWLQTRGVPLGRIAFLPSHGGQLGQQASTEHRQRWAAAQRVTADFGEDLPALLRRWLDLTAPPTEITGGGWRQYAVCGSAPVQPLWERRKFLGQGADGPVLIKFAGLGVIGERKLAMARALHAAGLVPEPLGLAHGFLVERWRDDCAALAADDCPVAEVAAYIAARARLFSAPDDSGASAETLLTMAKRNVSLALGNNAALNGWTSRVEALDARIRRVRTDSKMDRQEWLRAPDRRLIKTDALDHHAGHDIIGCQDLAWDVAGAMLELGLGRSLVDATEQAAGRAIDPELLAFYQIAYAAFRLGQASMAADAMADANADRARGLVERDRYAARLRDHLQLT